MSDTNETNQFPTAKVVSTRGKLSSRLWMLTLACLVLAIGLIWAEFLAGSTRIQITFSDGNGLMPGDVVRYRGIEVGEVTSVLLHPDLDRVVVTVDLNSRSSALAREGTRFWVERPDIRLGQIRGLDTLVGGRYVGVLPATVSAPFSTTFEGLSDPPATMELDQDGLEIVLESSQRFGLQRGSPVSYRGVEIGYVQSVGLSNDSSGVIARTFIKAEYHPLIRENSRFWSNSGIDLKLGLHGLELDAETLATIAAGGVALATPDFPGNRVATGHRFTLVKSPRDDWLKWRPQLAIGSAALPDGVPIPQPVLGVRRGKKTLGLFSNTRRGWLLTLDSGELIGPRDMLATSNDDGVNLEIGGLTLPLQDDADFENGNLAARPIDSTSTELDHAWPTSRIVTLDSAESIPAEMVITCGSDNMTMPLSKQRIVIDDDGWRLDPQVPIEESWHGACVLSASSGQLVGLLVHTELGMLLEPIPTDALAAVTHQE